MSSTATKSNIWRTSIAAPICAFCNKSVFPAEELNAAGQKFHKLCLKCSSFTEFSDVFRVWEENEFSSIFSKLSHTSQSRKSRWTWKEDLLFVVLPSSVRPTRRFEQWFNEKHFNILVIFLRSVGRGLTNSLLTPPTSPSPSRDEFEEKRTFPRYASMVPADDENRQAKRNTFAPGTKTRPTLNAVFNRSSINSITSGSAFRSLAITTNVCPRCSKTVYSAEEVKAVGKVFFFQFCHRLFLINFIFFINSSHFTNDATLALIATEVSMLVDILNTKEKFMITVSLFRFIVASLSNRTNIHRICLDCYQRLFGPKGVGFGIGSGALSTGQ